jgi:hypothetical protein
VAEQFGNRGSPEDHWQVMPSVLRVRMYSMRVSVDVTSLSVNTAEVVNLSVKS